MKIRVLRKLKQGLQDKIWRSKYGIVPAFLHIPKTGGTYLAQRESRTKIGKMRTRKPTIWPLRYLAHTYIVDDPGVSNILYGGVGSFTGKDKVRKRSELEHYFIVSSVRNIFDWLVSYTAARARYDINSEHSPQDSAPARKGLEYMIETIADRDDVWPCRKLIHAQLFSSGGILMPDWLCRTRTLDQDLEDFARKYGLIYKSGERQRVGHNAKDYREQYTDELVDLVNRVWAREINLFGFSFGEEDTEKGRLGREISPEDKAAVSYRWDKDELIVDGEVWK